jgi:two-component system sensor histidine kinase DesK
MKWPRLPTGEDKPAWAGLFGAAGLAYLFWDPYRDGAPWIDWFWAAVTCAVFFALVTLGLIYWSKRRVLQRLCVAMILVAVAYSAYRPAGMVLFVLAAGFAPLAVGGGLRQSAAAVGGIVLLSLAEWHLLRPPSPMPYIIALESFLVGAAITFVRERQRAVKLILQTAERERIARDMHDILGHALSVIALKAELAGRLLERDAARARGEIADVERLSRNALTEMREAIAGYRGGDLAAEFERARTTLATAGIAVDSERPAIPMPAAHERVLALVLREAVTNILRHAQARRCRLSLEQIDGVYRLEVSDDGRGVAAPEGLGMRGIRERVAAVGGAAAWISERGTRLSVTLPVELRAPHEA